jgi:hypothetical protein
MRRFTPRLIITASFVILVPLPLVVALHGEDPTSVPNGTLFPNPGGTLSTYSTTGAIDLTGPFFQSLGTNVRT